ncbi:ATP-binding protein [Pseudonocardia sp.]|uniref:ATP-binding protein n=1 Tax=Pseudonocardia sp. TaxID=60912 RepID=UPI003D0CCCC4
MQLLEREHPLSVLLERAERCARGEGCVALVTGEAGIGKTVLLRAFAAQVRSTVPALWGMCDSLSTPRPLGPLHDVAARLDPRLPDLLRGATAQHEIFTAVLDALATRPHVLVVEDLHWADEATLDLVRFLARRIAALPLLLVVSYRTEVGAGHPLGAVLGDLVTSPDSTRLQLTPLSRSAVLELVADLGLDAAHVHRRTAGNPFFVSQIVAQPDSPMPESVRDAVLARAAALDPSARHFLELLSCTPEPVGGALLAALGITSATVEALGRTGLLDRHGNGVTFRHEIARSAVLEAATPGSAPGLHATMLDALETVGAGSSVLTHHAVAAGDTVRVLRYARDAASLAARAGAHREAVAFYETALAHVGDDEPAARADLLEALSTELYLTDRLPDATASRVRALDLRRSAGEAAAVGAAHTAIAGFAWYAADRAGAERHVEEAIAILRDAGDPRAFGFALARDAFLAAHRGDTPAAHRSGARAARIADELGDDVVLRSTAAVGVAVARLFDGDVGGRADLLAASDVGLRFGLDDLATTPMSNLCHLDVEQGRYEQAEQSLAHALRVSEERDTPICTAWQLGVRSRLRLLQGRWADAEADARSVLTARDLPLSHLWPRMVLGLLVARRDAAPDNPHLDELWELVGRLDNPGMVAPAAAALAENAWITRSPDPRLDDPLVAGLFTRHYTGRDAVVAPLRRWLARLGDARGHRGPADAPSGLPYDDALRSWDSGAPEDLLAALPVLDGLGARPVADLFRARLRADGVSSVPRGAHAATRANPAGLTARQLDVLALLVDGLTNADIAARLVISPKTADHHVSAILAKLDVRSRAEAAAAARRLGLVATATVTPT